MLPQEMVKKRSLPFVFDESLPTRFGVLPRYAQNEDAMRWFEVPAVMMFHVANAWQEGNDIKLFSCCFDQVTLSYACAPPPTPPALAPSQQHMVPMTCPLHGHTHRLCRPCSCIAASGHSMC